MSYELSLGLSYDPRFELSYRLVSGLNMSVIVALVCVILAGSMESLRFAERIRWTWHGLLQSEHLRTSLIVTGALFLFIKLSNGLSLGQVTGPNDGLSYGLYSALSVGLSYWMLLGLYQGMKQEHLEDQDRQQFNQGIRRSLRNELLIALIGAIIIGTIGVLLSNVLNSEWPVVISAPPPPRHALNILQGLAPSNVLSLLFAGFVVMWALSGGLTVLRHYLIRWMLARSHRFPWRAQVFLDEATERNLLQRVGGGYRFMHRRLLNYFASLDDSSSPA